MSQEVDKHVLKKYETGKVLGKGAYGIVCTLLPKKSCTEDLCAAPA